jgi:hypothetical protein
LFLMFICTHLSTLGFWLGLSAISLLIPQLHTDPWRKLRTAVKLSKNGLSSLKVSMSFKVKRFNAFCLQSQVHVSNIPNEKKN